MILYKFQNLHTIKYFPKLNIILLSVQSEKIIQNKGAVAIYQKAFIVQYYSI